jgi:hypothetical protein
LAAGAVSATRSSESALTPDEWRNGLRAPEILRSRLREERNYRGLFALENALLPEGDPRKLTREMVDALRSWIADPYDPPLMTDGSTPDVDSARRLADVIEALLPPRR